MYPILTIAFWFLLTTITQDLLGSPNIIGVVSFHFLLLIVIEVQSGKEKNMVQPVICPSQGRKIHGQLNIEDQFIIQMYFLIDLKQFIFEKILRFTVPESGTIGPHYDI